jgi:O-antigen ligase
MSRLRLRSPGLKECGLAAFLTAGYFKADPRLAWLPVDLTLLFALWTLAALGVQALRERTLVLPRSTLLLLGLFLLLAPGLLAVGDSAYASDKAVRLFTLTLLAGVAPALLLRTPAELRRFLRALAVLGAVMALDGGVTLLTAPELERLQVFHSDTIALGRAAGSAFVWVSILWLERQLRTLTGVLLLVLLAGVMLASGTRASLLGGALALLVAFVRFYRGQGRVVARLVLCIGAAVVVFVAAYPFLPRGSLLRVQQSLQGEVDHSGLCRLQAYSQSLTLIAQQPLGIGLGGFAQRIPIKCGRVWLRYPHNMPIEVALESGLPAALLLGALGVAAVRTADRAARQSGRMEARALFALLVFFCVNVMFSGDLNDNKVCLALLGLALGAGRVRWPAVAGEWAARAQALKRGERSTPVGRTHPNGGRHVPPMPHALPVREVGPPRPALPGHRPLRP